MKKLSSAIYLALVLFTTSCHHEEEARDMETQYIVTSPLKKDTLINKEYVCQIRSIQHIDLRALEKGYLQNIYID